MVWGKLSNAAAAAGTISRRNVLLISTDCFEEDQPLLS